MDPVKPSSSDSDSDGVKGKSSEPVPVPDQGKSTLEEEKMTARPVKVTEPDTDGHNTETEPATTSAVLPIPAPAAPADQGGSSQSSAVAVVTEEPGTSGGAGAGAGNNGDGDPREPTKLLTALAEVLQKQEYLAKGKFFLSLELGLQGAVLVAAAVAFYFRDDPFVADNFKAIIGLFAVASLSLTLELRLSCRVKPPPEMALSTYSMHPRPRWSCCCVMWLCFIIARVVVYILLSVFLATRWLGISICIFGLLVTIPEIFIMGKLLSRERLQYQRLKTVTRTRRREVEV